MTFTYNLVTPDDITRVRFHLGDTSEPVAMFSDEEIQFAIDEETTWRAAVIACIRSIMARLAAEPDMQADWLKIDWRRSQENSALLLNEKMQQFGLGKARAASGGQHAYRVDGLQKSEPDWENDAVEDSSLW